MAVRRSSNRTPRTSVVRRFGGLPLVSSSTQLAVATYSDMKRSFWLTRSVFGLVEGSVRLAARLAARGIQPILESFESQINVANDVAAHRLDRLEETFPILQLSVDEVISHLGEPITLSLEDAQERFTLGRKGLMKRTTAAMERVQESVSGQATAFLNTSLGQALEAGGVQVLVRLDRAVDHYLPNNEEDGSENCSAGDGQAEEQPSLVPQARRLLLKFGLRWQHRALVYTETLWEGTLTRALLISEGLDRLSRSQPLPLRLLVSGISHLSQLQLQLQARLSRTGRSLMQIGHSCLLLTQQLLQGPELAMLVMMLFLNVLVNLLLEPEEQEEGEESGEESADDLYDMGLWTGRGQSSQGQMILLDQETIQRMLEQVNWRQHSRHQEQPDRGLNLSPSPEPQSPDERNMNEQLFGPRRPSLAEQVQGDPCNSRAPSVADIAQ
ncbi:uncharacterized protein [Hemitrygon akajei]|uniref:uncharacterized protein n=1 Tax=Hemitrygon akajei TaxID=2704970 RepID=UPI003BF961F9